MLQKSNKRNHAAVFRSATFCYKPRVLPALLNVFLAPSVWADCNAHLPASTPDTQFSLDTPAAGAALVHDGKTGLTWMRCSLGQQWNATSNQCLNDPAQAWSFTWTQALAAAKSSRYAGLSDWRLPNKKELASIVDLRCWQPAINPVVFPDSPMGKFWTASPVTYSDQFYAWYVDFADGSYGNLGNDKLLWVRLVRDDS